MSAINDRVKNDAERIPVGLLRSLVHWIDQTNDRVGRAISWLTAIMVIVTTSDVIMRYLLNSSYVFIQELEWHLFAILFLMAAGYTHLKGGHMRVDIFYARFAPRTQALVDLF